MMKAVLLAAGLGTRLKPITDNIPKCLVPINGKPLLHYWIAMLQYDPHIEEIFINLHYKSDMVEEYLAHAWPNNSKIKTLYEEKLLGTAGTIKQNYSLLRGEHCFVVHADNFSQFNFCEFKKHHFSALNEAEITMMLFETDQPQQCGIVVINDQGTVVSMHEKEPNPPGNLANGAVYLFKPDVIEKIYLKNWHDISNQVIPAYLGKISSWKNTVYHRDIGTIESYNRANADAKVLSLLADNDKG